jgi:DNA-directed RNA polymerase specialized sigma24 family protein
VTLNASLVVEGHEGPHEFFQRTRSDWDRVARYVLKRAPEIPGIGEDDIRQELQLVAWRALKSYDAKRSSNPDRYLIFQAVARTNRWLRRQLRRGGRAGTPEVVGDVDLDHFEHESTQRPDKSVEARSELRRLIDQISTRSGSIALAAVISAEGDLDLAAQSIYEDPRLSLYYRFYEPGDARRFVKTEINQMRSDGK